MAEASETPDRDEESGQWTEGYRDEEFLGALREHGGLTATATVGETVGCGRDTARVRLKELAEAGRVERHQPSRSIFWRLPDAD